MSEDKGEPKNRGNRRKSAEEAAQAEQAKPLTAENSLVPVPENISAPATVPALVAQPAPSAVPPLLPAPPVQTQATKQVEQEESILAKWGWYIFLIVFAILHFFLPMLIDFFSPILGSWGTYVASNYNSLQIVSGSLVLVSAVTTILVYSGHLVQRNFFWNAQDKDDYDFSVYYYFRVSQRDFLTIFACSYISGILLALFIFFAGIVSAYTSLLPFVVSIVVSCSLFYDMPPYILRRLRVDELDARFTTERKPKIEKELEGKAREVENFESQHKAALAAQDNSIIEQLKSLTYQKDKLAKRLSRLNGTEASKPPTSDSTIYDENTHALMYAWTRLLEFDRASTYQKQNYIRFRKIIIAINVIVTGVALFAALIPEIIVWIPDFTALQPQMTGFAKAILVALPLGSAALFNYAQRYASSDWIEFRRNAEKIRSLIYKFVQEADEFQKPPGGKTKANFLKEKVDKIAQDRQQNKQVIPYLGETIADKNVLQRLVKEQAHEQSEDIYAKIDINDYIKNRLNAQKEWYTRRVEQDHANARRYFAIAQIVVIAGGVLAAFDNQALVALTVSIAVAINLYTDVEGYGKTYGIYHQAAEKLKAAHGDWNIKEKPADDTALKIIEADLVKQVEKILSDEREEWYLATTQMQAKVAQSLQGKLDVPATDAAVTDEAKLQMQLARAKDVFIKYLITRPNSVDAVAEWKKLKEDEELFGEETWVNEKFGLEAAYKKEIKEIIDLANQ